MRIIVAFPKLEDAKNLRNVLIRNGFDDTMAYNNAAQTIGAAWLYAATSCRICITANCMVIFRENFRCCLSPVLRDWKIVSAQILFVCPCPSIAVNL